MAEQSQKLQSSPFLRELVCWNATLAYYESLVARGQDLAQPELDEYAQFYAVKALKTQFVVSRAVMALASFRLLSSLVHVVFKFRATCPCFWQPRGHGRIEDAPNRATFTSRSEHRHLGM